MDYVTDDWADPVVDALNRKYSYLNWEATIAPLDSSWARKIQYRNSGMVALNTSWIIRCELGEWRLIFTLEASNGAVEVKKGGVKPALILREEESSNILFKKVMKQPHNKVNALNPSGYNFSMVFLQYSLKPFVDKMLGAISEKIDAILDSLFAVDDIPMLGREVISAYPNSADALSEAMTSGDLAFINNRITLEHLGSPKIASAIRVANMYLTSSSDFYTLEMSFLDKNPLRPPSKRQHSEKVVSVKDESALDREINTFIRKYSPLFMRASDGLFTLIGEDGNSLFFRYDFPSVSGRSYQEAHIRVTSKQVSDVETLKDILYHGTILSHAIDAQS